MNTTMDRHKFYITLPSNVQSPSYHSNKISHYLTILPKAVQVDSEQWEVALCEISYPHSWNNIYSPINHVSFSYINSLTKRRITDRTEIPKGFYKDTTSVLEAINKVSPTDFQGNIAFERFGREKIKVVLYANETMKLNSTLAQLLGFEKNQWAYNVREGDPLDDVNGEMEGDDSSVQLKSPRLRFKAKHHGDIQAMMHNFYVYCSCIKDNLVGDKYVPLLRTVNVDGSDGDFIHKVYENPHYLPLAADFTEHIEIKLATDQGTPVRFKWGKVIVKLHFRKKSFW